MYSTVVPLPTIVCFEPSSVHISLPAFSPWGVHYSVGRCYWYLARDLLNFPFRKKWFTYYTKVDTLNFTLAFAGFSLDFTLFTPPPPFYSLVHGIYIVEKSKLKHTLAYTPEPRIYFSARLGWMMYTCRNFKLYGLTLYMQNAQKQNICYCYGMYIFNMDSEMYSRHHT